jgi:hypothetical protein
MNIQGYEFHRTSNGYSADVDGAKIILDLVMSDPDVFEATVFKSGHREAQARFEGSKEESARRAVEWVRP